MEFIAALAPSVTAFGRDSSPASGGAQKASSSPVHGGGGSVPSVETEKVREVARAKIDKTARDFEASFLSVMLGQMFSGLETSAPFGGGQGEQMYKSFMTDTFARSMADRGGVGVSKAVRTELLKLQGLEP